MKTRKPITFATLFHALEWLAPASLPSRLRGLEVSAVVADSRKAMGGCLFVALPGERTDGRLYIQEAIDKGCLAVVVEGHEPERKWSVPCLQVQDAHFALSELAAAWHGYPARDLCLIGVTGTNGKTTTTWLIEAMLLGAGFRPGVIGTVNYRYQGLTGPQILQEAPLTTPDPLTLQGILRRMADEGVTHVVMEVSSHALQQKRLGATAFDVAAFTNLTRDHLDYHQDMEGYFAAKELLFTTHLRPSGAAVVAAFAVSEENTMDWAERIAASARCQRVLRSGFLPQCQVRAEEIDNNLGGFSCLLRVNNESQLFRSPLAGLYNLMNVLSAVGVGAALGLPFDSIVKALSTLNAVPGRLERVRPSDPSHATSPTVFVDYAHSPDALENVLRTLKGLVQGRLICVFGCGGDRDRGKRPLMGAIAARFADVVLVTSDNPRREDPQAIIADIIPGLTQAGRSALPLAALFGQEGKRQGYAILPDRSAAITAACSLAAAEDTVLVAGKGHEDYQVVGREKRFFDDRLEVRKALACWSLPHLLAASSAVLVRSGGCAVLGQIRTDSRLVQAGDIFVALRGENMDGHDFIPQAVDKGAAVIIGECFQQPTPAVFCLQVADSLRALGDLAAYRRRLFTKTTQVLAITGSSGKTSVKEMTAAIAEVALGNQWAWRDPVLKTQGNFNNLIGLPLSLLPLHAGHRLAVLEMGMNAPGEIARLCEIADPDIACINTIHPAHLAGLGSIEAVAAAKGELFAGLRPEAIRVVNCDDPRIVELARQSGGRQIGFSVTAAGRRLHPLIRLTRLANLGERGIAFTLHIGEWRARLKVAALGLHNAANCAAAAALAHAAGMSPELIAEGLRRYRPIDKRMMMVELVGGVRLVNDAYNANPASMAAGLEAVAALGKGGKHFAILGDMLELGEAALEEHCKIGALVAKLGYDYLAVAGEQAQALAQAARDAGMAESTVRAFTRAEDIAPWCAQLMQDKKIQAGDWILLKGSRGMRMERCLEALQGQGTTQENRTNAL